MMKTNKFHKKITQITSYCAMIIFVLACSDHPNCSSGKGMWDDREIRVVNNSNQAVLVFYSSGYPDTNALNVKNQSNYSTAKSINSPRDATFISACDWESHFEEAGGILMFFVFLDDLEEGIDAPHFMERDDLESRTQLKRYDLTIEDVKQMNWELVYP